MRMAIRAANGCAADFFQSPLAARRSLRRAAGYSGRTHRLAGGADTTRTVATAGVGYLSTSVREWFHMTADPATLDQMRWPCEAFQEAMLLLIHVLEGTCNEILQALADQSEVVARHVAAVAADKERWGDPSVLDVFHYTHALDHRRRRDRAPDARLYAMGSHTDPGLLTITPCSQIPALELQDNISGKWVDAERPGVSGVSGTQGKHALLVFAGDALEDCGCVAVAHRVRYTQQERLSLVYEMRRWEQDAEAGLDANSSVGCCMEQTTGHSALGSSWPSDSRPQHQVVHLGKKRDSTEDRVRQKRAKCDSD